MKISVIIPVYNAERFIDKAVQSAVVLAQVCEVLVINDGSTDKTKEILLNIDSDKLKILEHPNGVNKGRSATRNLGIVNATCPYISFLDADDFYLPHRFEKDELVFKNNSKCDGVYNAIGSVFYREITAAEQDELKLTTVTQYIDPKELFVQLIRGYCGLFSIDGLTVKKNALTKVGLFNESFDVMEDTEWIWKLAFFCDLLPGDILEPVTMRGVHDSNIFNNTEVYKRNEEAFFKELIDWSVKQDMELDRIELFVERLWITINKYHKGVSKLFYAWIVTFIPRPRLLFSYLAYRYFPLVYKWKSIRNKLT